MIIMEEDNVDGAFGGRKERALGDGRGNRRKEEKGEKL